MIKIISIDLDGTLLNSKSQVSYKNKEAIKKCLEKDIKIVMNTGKSSVFVKKLVRDLGLKDLQVLSNGALIIDSVFKPVFVFRLPEHLYVEIIGFFRKNDRGVVVHWFDYNVGYEQNNPFFSEITNSGEVIREVKDLLDPEIINNAIMCTYAGIIGDEIYNSMVRKFENRLKIRQAGENLVDLISMDAGKVNAVKRILEMYGIDKQELMAIGNNENDVGMIKFAGIGVAMGNSSASATKAADFMVADNDSDGVAEAICRYVLK